MLLYLIGLIISGLVVGALARLALPGKDPMSIPMTIGIGIAGSFVGGLIVAAAHGPMRSSSTASANATSSDPPG